MNRHHGSHAHAGVDFEMYFMYFSETTKGGNDENEHEHPEDFSELCAPLFRPPDRCNPRCS